MEKKAYQYKLTLEGIADPQGQPMGQEQLELHIRNHDDLYQVIRMTQDRQLFAAADSTELALGLKLFSEVMLRHRGHPLFAELAPAFGAFMKKLKGK